MEAESKARCGAAKELDRGRPRRDVRRCVAVDGCVPDTNRWPHEAAFVLTAGLRSCLKNRRTVTCGRCRRDRSNPASDTGRLPARAGMCRGPRIARSFRRWRSGPARGPRSVSGMPHRSARSRWSRLVKRSFRVCRFHGSWTSTKTLPVTRETTPHPSRGSPVAQIPWIRNDLPDQGSHRRSNGCAGTAAGRCPCSRS